MNIDLLVTHEADGYHQNKGKDKQKEIDHHDFCKKKKAYPHLIHVLLFKIFEKNLKHTIGV